MWILAAAHGLGGFEVVAALLDGGVNVALVVAGRAAFINTLALGGVRGEWTKGRRGRTGERGLARRGVLKARRRIVCGGCELRLWTRRRAWERVL